MRARANRCLQPPILILAGVFVSCVSMLLKNELAPTIVFAPYDDGLFLRLADSLRSGAWLGPYDGLTLAKGPAYPIFLASTSTAQLPLKPVEHAIYLGGAALCALVTYRLAQRRWLALVVFAVLAMNPVMWSANLARIIRDGFYTGLSLIVIAAVAWLLLVEMQRRRVAPMAAGAGAAVLVGAAIGLYWLTRQEGVWLIPALFVIAAGGAWSLFSVQDASPLALPPDVWRRVVRPFGLRGILIVGGLGLVIGGTAGINAKAYGLPLVNDFTGGSFPAAYGAFTRIEHPITDRYVPAPASARRAAYKVSAAAAELEPFLEGDLGAMWTSISCGGPPDPSLGCSDIRAGWFPWALREAVGLAGHWGSLQESQEFMQRLAEEINAACDGRRLSCGPPRSSTTPPIGVGEVLEAIAYFPAAMSAMTGAGTTIDFGQSYANANELVRVALLYGRVAPAHVSTGDLLRIQGWVAAIGSMPWIGMQVLGAADVRTEVTQDPAPDVDAFLASNGLTGYGTLRFDMVTGCTQAECSLVVGDGTGEAYGTRVSDITPGRLLDSPPLLIHVDRIQSLPADPLVSAATASADPRLFAVMHAIQSAYATLMPVLMAAAVVGTMVALLLPQVRKRYAGIIIFTIACAVAMVARMTLVALIEVTSWPGAINDVYLAPASPFLLTFVVLGTYLAGISVAELLGRNASHQSPAATRDSSA